MGEMNDAADSTTRKRKAIALISGGLDSMLAAKVIMEQGIEVHGLNFFTGFCVEGHTSAIRERHKVKSKRNNALWSVEQLGIPLHIIDISFEYKDIVLRPKHGYGQHLNPCLDCKIFMVNQASAWGYAEQHGFDFVITGEVIGQRPKSQRREAMPVIARESGVGDRLLRPLCALNLAPTLPEREGWVDRARLFGFHGRDRKPQIELAKHFGFKDYSQPAGGCCFLTDKHYSTKLADLWHSRGKRDYELDDIMLLKVGRHVRPNGRFKLIIGREQGENKYLRGYRKRFASLRMVSHEGPLTLIDGDPQGDDLELAARIVGRYSQGRDANRVELELTWPDGRGQALHVAPFSPLEIPDAWHV